MATELAKAYEPKTVEEEIYARWEKSGFFNPNRLPGKRSKPFTIIMPPPNANGALHIGHALFVTLEDIMIRYKRMRGFKTLWLPGADHAGFETQYVFDKKLAAEGKHRGDFSREELYRQIWDFTQKNRTVMENQLRKLGASCDWSRKKFTLDPDIVEEVQNTFIQLHKDGLIYRGSRIVNWSVKDQTALSDLEIKHEERIDPLYYIKYGPLVLATVRPETKFGDTAVAVHPRDKRYQQYVGREIEIETVLGKAKIKVIADEAVDQKFGTGVVKVTPAHDLADFEIAERHHLEIKQVIDRYGRMNEKAGPYQGMKIEEARKKVAEDLQAKGLIAKIDEGYRHAVAIAERSGGVIEPMVMPQWFVKMTEKGNKNISLRDAAVQAVKAGKIKIIPERFNKIFFQWMANLRDWNISRQVIWGIRIPAWFCHCTGEHQAIIVAKKPPTIKCAGCKSDWQQDPDVLDTWFSSGQWPFLTLGFPNGKDFKTFYPTSVMETGWDIFFLWVTRMIMFGIYRAGKIPFETVYLHGLVLAQDRKKMSKSKGNVIDPLGVAELYGTDAVRMALIIGNTPGSNTAISEDKIRGYRNFANKIWNASRFVLLNANQKIENKKSKIKFTADDKKRLKELDSLVKSVTKDLSDFRFHHAGEKLYHYFWHTFADKIIESVKPRLKGNDIADRAAAVELLYIILETNLKLLHPFMPYATEAIWKKLPGERGLLMVEGWPNLN